MNTRTKKLEQVRALLAKADSTKFPAEADSFRAKAASLMTRFAIEQWQVDAAQAGTEARPEPESRRFDITWYQENSRRNELWALMQTTAQHCRVKLVYWVYNGKELPAVGLPSDLDYFDMLFTHLMVQMSKGLEPHPDRDKSMIENLVVMKEAGMKWERIGELLISVDQLDFYDRNMGVKFTKLYTDYCRDHKRPRLRTTPAVYQRSYATGFVQEIRAKMRNEDAQYKGTGAELAVRDINGYIHQAARDKFGIEPRPRYKKSAMGKIDRGAYEAGSEDGRRAHVINPSEGQLGGRKELAQ